MPISSAVWSNLTVRGRGTGMGCWILATVTCLLPLARVGAVCARLGPPTAVGVGPTVRLTRLSSCHPVLSVLVVTVCLLPSVSHPESGLWRG